MRALHAIFCLVALSAALSLTSCDTMSSVDYKIYNMTEDSVTVTFYKEILVSPYEGYYIDENDSVTTFYGKEDSTYVAVLKPGQVLWTHNDWEGQYREERVVHLWEYIRSISIGEKELDPAAWNNEAAWHLKTEGGGRFSKEESRYYDLFLRK